MSIMLTLTMSAPSLLRKLSPNGLMGLPRIAREKYNLHGINLTTNLLKGADRRSLMQLRDVADRAGCAALVLIEPPISLLSPKRTTAEAAMLRCRKLLEAAACLGCNSLALGISGEDSQLNFDRAVDRLKTVSDIAEDRQLNVLIAPSEGITADPERVTEIIKKVGGFRIGTFPDFQAAAATDDPEGYLRKLVPYAWAVSASTIDFVNPGADLPGLAGEASADGAPAEDDEDAALDAELAAMFTAPEHVPYDLDALVAAVASVGYDGTMGIDYRGNAGILGIEHSCQALECALDHLKS